MCLDIPVAAVWMSTPLIVTPAAHSSSHSLNAASSKVTCLACHVLFCFFVVNPLGSSRVNGWQLIYSLFYLISWNVVGVISKHKLHKGPFITLDKDLQFILQAESTKFNVPPCF